MTFTRRWEDTDGQYYGYKSLCLYNGELCFFDRGLAVNNGRMMRTSDGLTWTQLYSALGATYGNFTEFDGCDLAIYNDSLFVTLYRVDAVNPKVLEWDGTNLVAHLPNPQGGGLNNYMASALESWARRLWCLTDVTAGALGRRVVYYYDGTSWNAITDYDGAAYLDHNIAAVRFPQYIIKHRTSRLFVYHGELYLLASRSPDSNAWAWEVWRFDAEDMDNFELVFDSSTFGDNFALSAIIVHDDKIKLLGNELTYNGNPTDIAKLYSSEDMENWTEETDFAIFEDEFDDATRGPRWTDEANNGTITEGAGVLNLSVAGGVNGDFWGATKNAPIVTMEPGKDEITVVTKLIMPVVNDWTRAGIYITDVVSGFNGIHFGRVKNSTLGRDGVQVLDMNAASLGYAVRASTDPLWLRVRISASGASNVMRFDWSDDGVYWYYLCQATTESWDKVGFAAWNWGPFNAVSADFEYIHIYESMGFPFGEAVFDGKFYLNCQNTLRDVTWIRHWDGRLHQFTLDQEIATHTNQRGGGMAVYPTASVPELFAGKYREIYAEPCATRKDMRRKRGSLWLVKMNWRNKKGENLEELVAPIDVRADERFWSGRIKELSSFTRAIDDRTGLFKVADCSMKLANNDKRYSKRLVSYFLKDELCRIYHAWADEPEAWRRHIITLTVDDYDLVGPHFNVKLKDVTKRYFDAKIPESICTQGDYPNIHEDHIGRYMPEVLGSVSMIGGEKHGAVEAVYVNTDGPPYQYIAACGELDGIDTVYSDNVDLGGGNWAFVPGPPSMINITPDQGDKNITYDGRGYKYGIWNDPTSGYVQNPAYVTAYFLRVLMGLPAALINILSFDAMADYFESIGESQTGKFILQDSGDTMEFFRQLLFSFGMKGFVALDGEMMVDRKDIHNYATNTFVFDQVDLMSSGARRYNMKNAVTSIKARYNYIPWARLWLGADEEAVESYFRGGPIEDDIRDKAPLPV